MQLTTVDALSTVYGLTLTMLLLGGGATFLFYRRLKNSHAEKWVELGEPSMFFGNSAASQFRLTAFLWRSRYRELDDQYLTLLGVAVKSAGVGCILLILVGMALVGRA